MISAVLPTHAKPELVSGRCTTWLQLGAGIGQDERVPTEALGSTDPAKASISAGRPVQTAATIVPGLKYVVVRVRNMLCLLRETEQILAPPNSFRNAVTFSASRKRGNSSGIQLSALGKRGWEKVSIFLNRDLKVGRGRNMHQETQAGRKSISRWGTVRREESASC